jgi:hypothetical protein
MRAKFCCLRNSTTTFQEAAGTPYIQEMHCQLYSRYDVQEVWGEEDVAPAGLGVRDPQLPLHLSALPGLQVGPTLRQYFTSYQRL